jgi:hypothetical protein
VNEDGTDRVKRFYKARKTACKRAGVGVRIFHDFRTGPPSGTWTALGFPAG